MVNCSRGNGWFVTTIRPNSNRFYLKTGDTLIGRGGISDISIPSMQCSRFHCTIHLSSTGTVTIRDHSLNGTFINGQRKTIANLNENDRFSIGFPIHQVAAGKLHLFDDCIFILKRSETSAELNRTDDETDNELQMDLFENKTKISRNQLKRAIESVLNSDDGENTGPAAKMPKGENNLDRTAAVNVKSIRLNPYSRIGQCSRYARALSANSARRVKPTEIYRSFEFSSYYSYPMIFPSYRSVDYSSTYMGANYSSLSNLFSSVSVCYNRYSAEIAINNQVEQENRIISVVTSWQCCDLLTKKRKNPPLMENYSNSVNQAFDNWYQFQRIFENLLKCEIWTRLQKRLAVRTRTDVTVSKSKLEKRDKTNRMIYDCNVENSVGRTFERGDIVLVKTQDSLFLAFVTASSPLVKNNRRSFTMETAQIKHLTNFSAQTYSFQIISKANIMLEVNLYKTIYHSAKSAFIMRIINPTKFAVDLSTPESPQNKHLFNYLSFKQSNILSEIQNQCVDSMKSNSPHLVMIEGPPGSGKTRMIVELVKSTIFSTNENSPKKILITANSSEAVDLITRQLNNFHSSLKPDQKNQMCLIRYGPAGKNYADIRKLMPKNLINSAGSTSSLSLYERYISWFKKANIVCCPLREMFALQRYVKKFDLCILDDASECIVLSSLMPLMFEPSSFILFGDKDKKPTDVLNATCLLNAFDQSLFARLLHGFDRCNVKVYPLHEPYCMRPSLYNFINTCFHQNELQPLNKVPDDDEFMFQAYAVFNEAELNFVIALIRFLTQHADPSVYTYSIVVPTETEKNLLEQDSDVSSKIAITTGKEFSKEPKDIVIIWSTIKIVASKELTTDSSLLAVMSRAKKSLILCGNFRTALDVPIWRTILSDASDRKCIRSVDDGCHMEAMKTILSEKCVQQQQSKK